MNIFKCQHCGLMLFFDNRNCERCGHVLGYLPLENELSALKQEGYFWEALAAPGKQFKFCKNAQRDACNWLTYASEAEDFCIACRHNRTVPDLSSENNLRDWRKMELAKHRLFYTLLRLNLPLENRNDNPAHGLAFDFLADPGNGNRIMTGHANGIITLTLEEADDAVRETRRTRMHEPYRTLLGHFRHEIGHYYWDRLVRDRNRQASFRALFGDERADYGEALRSHYQNGAPSNWGDSYVSAYATSHPWEDFAETWAHYLHIVDGLETSDAFGLSVHPAVAPDQELHVETAIDPYTAESSEQLVELWIPLTYALNAMNRSMGSNDLYPFVLSPPVRKKLSYIHGLMHNDVAEP